MVPKNAPESSAKCYVKVQAVVIEGARGLGREENDQNVQQMKGKVKVKQCLNHRFCLLSLGIKETVVAQSGK